MLSREPFIQSRKGNPQPEQAWSAFLFPADIVLRLLSDRPRGSWILVAAYEKVKDIKQQKKEHKEKHKHLPSNLRPTFKEQKSLASCKTILWENEVLWGEVLLQIELPGFQGFK